MVLYQGGYAETFDLHSVVLLAFMMSHELNLPHLRQAVQAIRCIKDFAASHN